MSAYLDIHPVDPQPRLIRKAVDIINDGGVIAYPTDSGYAVGCKLGNRAGLERIQKIRKLPSSHNYTLVCHDFSQLGHMVIVDNAAYRVIKALTPGPFTFIMKGDREIPRIMLNPKKKTVGARIPNHKTALALVAELGEPIMSSTLIMPDRNEPESNGWAIRDEIGYLLDAVIEGEIGQAGATTVIDMTGPEGPVVVRQGAGDASAYFDQA
ncbi:threonylcarbamoyl-AMP synthase [Nanchangia anserum]|uniref:Threonylcarbamoyl-AMP synthase n=1 Tax=Nanchangia anserum TaxID=2692125 RepID=A0A8I0GB45_9ACTO|nr:L-threonylcarbamoyladenylate synthase [Nanchangia anserum]MBD3688766.1 threonylcarbamoyl-AMP synthase [Nanchangia anserum]QOX82505.1 threonylcarbamoyl-AMP synthase [Nanchangia anserum]